MNTKQTASMLEDRKVNVKAKLALLWVALMFLYIYNDLFSLFQPGHVAELVEGQLGGVQFTQTLLFKRGRTNGVSELYGRTVLDIKGQS